MLSVMIHYVVNICRVTVFICFIFLQLCTSVEHIIVKEIQSESFFATVASENIFSTVSLKCPKPVQKELKTASIAVSLVIQFCGSQPPHLQVMI